MLRRVATTLVAALILIVALPLSATAEGTVEFDTPTPVGPGAVGAGASSDQSGSPDAPAPPPGGTDSGGGFEAGGNGGGSGESLNCSVGNNSGYVDPNGFYVRPDADTPVGVACALPTDGGAAAAPAPVIDYPGLAYQAFVQIKFEPPAIGMAPKVNPEWGHRRTYVGLPVWMWVDSPSALSWGPYNSTHDLAGVTFTFAAQVDRIVWDMGDGTTVTCGLGDIYTPAYGNVKSPTCGHVYQHVSEDQPGGMYAVSATAYWNVDWTAGGQSGTIPLELTSTTEVEVRQLQSVNVPVDPNGG